MKKKYEFKSVVAETLLIPLYMRAKESRRKDAILRDLQAEQLVESIEYDYSKFDGAKLSAIGCVVRGLYFDNTIRHFIATRKNPIIVNVGCGLDTRYQRIEEHDKAIFYEMDLPEVIDLRRDLLPEPAGDHYIAGSLLETQWMDDLRKKHPEGEFIIVIEGVLMYFYEKQVRQLLTRLADRFSGGEVWFDVCGPMMANSKYITAVTPARTAAHAATAASVRCSTLSAQLAARPARFPSSPVRTVRSTAPTALLA